MSKFCINATSPFFDGVVIRVAEYETMEEAKSAFAIIKAQREKQSVYEVSEETSTSMKVEGSGLCVNWYISEE